MALPFLVALVVDGPDGVQALSVPLIGVIHQRSGKTRSRLAA